MGIANNEPAFIAKYFVDCVKAAGGTARIVRADLGTEHTYSLSKTVERLISRLRRVISRLISRL